MKVLCIGKVLLDVIVKNAQRFPVRYLASMVEKIDMCPGGGGAITAETFAKLGHEVHLISCVGRDTEAGYLLDLLARAEIPVNRIYQLDSVPTLRNIVAVDSQGNARYLMLQDDGLPQSLTTRLPIDEQYDLIHFSTVEQLVADDGEPLAKWIKEYRRRYPQTIISADTSKITSYSHRTINVLSDIDYFFGNHVELSKTADQSPESHRMGVERTTPAAVMQLVKSLGVRKGVILKLGADGSAALIEGSAIHKPALELTSVENENGAGDVFCAVFLSSALSGDSISECLETANVVAGRYIEDPSKFKRLNLLQTEAILNDSAATPRSRDLSISSTWWRFPQSVQGYGARFDTSRALSQREENFWISELAQLLPTNSAPLKVLDAGCGTGRFSIPIHNALKCEMVGIDLSEEMLCVARKKSPNIRWVLGDLCKLDSYLSQDLGTFDCIWMSSVLNQIIEDLADIFSQIYAQLKPGGLLAIRMASKELIGETRWLDYFPKARSLANERSPKVGTIISYLIDSGFSLVQAKRLDIEETLEVDEFEKRIRHRGNTWSSLMSESEINSCINALRTGHPGGFLLYQRPKYFLALRKK